MSASIYAANNLVIRANNEHVNITPLKLQKLLYLLYARFLYKTDIPLFPDRFEAWQYGPVVSDVYDAFRSYGANHIDQPKANPDGTTSIFSEVGEYAQCLNEVWCLHGRKSANSLVSLTHSSGSAWSMAKKENDEHLGGLLSDDAIKDDGRRLFE